MEKNKLSNTNLSSETTFGVGKNRKLTKLSKQHIEKEVLECFKVSFFYSIGGVTKHGKQL